MIAAPGAQCVWGQPKMAQGIAMIKLEPHPYSEIFPEPNEQVDGFLELESSILEQGIIVPIVLYQGKVLDGRRRYMVYVRNSDKIEIKTEDFVGTDEQALAR